MIDVDYTNKQTLLDFGDMLLSLTDEQKAIVAAFVVDRGLMSPKGISANLIWFFVRGVARFKKIDRAIVFSIVLDRSREYADDIIQQTVQWMIDGKDTTDVKSAGGFNKDEIQTLCNIMNVTLAVSNSFGDLE